MTFNKGHVALITIVSLLTGAALALAGVTLFYDRGDPVDLSAEEFYTLAQFNQKYAKLEQLSNFVEENFYKEVIPEDLMTGMYRGLFYGLDDMYSYYMTADEYDALNVSMSSEFQGIGITFSYNEEYKLVIISTIDESPAEKAGLMPGDIILMVDDIPYTAADMDTAGAHMRGTPGTKVKLTISRDGETREFVIIRATIVKHSIKTEMLDNNIAYVRISSFEDNTGEEFQNELRALEMKGVNGMVIDVRNNGGGVVKAGEKVADLLLPECTIVYLVDNQGNKRSSNSDRNATGIPYVLLINGGTASTSEILAAAIKDNNGGKLVGTKTFGKGVVQSVIQLDDGSGDAIKLTTSQYLSPAGNVIHQKGIEPDYTVELIEDDERDYQLERAVKLLLQNR